MLVRTPFGADMITGIDMAVNGVMGGILGAINAANGPPPPPPPPPPSLLSNPIVLLGGGAVLLYFLMQKEAPTL